MVLDKVNLKKVDKKYINNFVSRKISPSTLIKKERIDLIPKYLYVKDRDNDIKSEYHKNLYLNHIKAFNNFNENDGRGKIGKKRFIEDFKSIIKDVGLSGFDPSKSLVPISKEGIILDGAHRIATSFYYSTNVHILDTSAKSPIYDLSFFNNRGMSSEDLESILLNYVMIKDGVYVAILWGNASKKHHLVKSILNQSNNNLIYDKRINLTKKGMKNIIINCYNGQDWIGDISNGYSGYISKMKHCFNKKSEARIFIFEAKNIKDVLKMKKEIRDLFDIGNHSIHITDTGEESVYLLKTFLNKNSLHHLNFSDVKNFKKFHHLFSKFKKEIAKKSIDKENICIVSSAVLSAYGIRDCRDLDYIIIGRKIVDLSDANIDSHNSHFKEEVLPELITNPNNYFYFNGVKFLNLDKILSMKKRRGERKDLRDINLAKLYFSEDGNFSWKIKKILNEFESNFYNNFFYIRIRLVRLVAKHMSEDFKSHLKRHLRF